MTTPLASPISRQLALKVDGRAVIVTLVPGEPPLIEFRLKGTRRTRKVSLRLVMEHAGWSADFQRAPEPPTHAQQLKELLDHLERAPC